MTGPVEVLPNGSPSPISHAAVSDWLAEQAVGTVAIGDLFGGLCQRIRKAGLPLKRASIIWPALHPLVMAESLVWQASDGVEHQLSSNRFDGPTEAWLRSPFPALLASDDDMMRRRLSGPDRLTDFPTLEELAADGLTDYIATKTRIDLPSVRGGTTGMLASWATDRPDGFTQHEIDVLIHVQRHFAIAFRTSVLSGILRTVCDVYLGPTAGSRVLNGAIRRGDGETITAVVWYSDLRGSTTMAETMTRDGYLATLNRYFECTAGAVSDAGGEVLSFIGDAVLAIFPYDTAAGRDAAARKAVAATRDALHRRDATNAIVNLPITFGIGIHHGKVMFGNIGVPDRLSFSVIGPTVNEVARLEALTKTLDTPVATSATFAALVPEAWRPCGRHALRGIAEPVDIYIWAE